MEKLKLEVTEDYERWLYAHIPWEREPDRGVQYEDGIRLPITLPSGRETHRLWLPSGHIIPPPIRGGSRFFTSGSSQFLQVDAAPVTAFPFTMQVMVRPVSASLAKAIMYLVDKATTTHYFGIVDSWPSTDDVLFQCAAGGAAANATSSTTPLANIWQMRTGVARSATSRDCYVDGGGKGSSATSRTPAGIDRITIGRWGTANPADGLIAEASIWNQALSDTEVAINGKTRQSVLQIGTRLEHLVFYLPMTGDTPGPEYEVTQRTAARVLQSTAYPSPHDSHPFTSYRPRPQTKILTRVKGAASAVITGTITASVTEADIVTGGKTLIITLTGDTWIAAGAASFDLQRDEIIAGVDSAQSEALGWDLVPKALQSLGGVVRTSDTVVTITWDAFATYNITAQETITVTIPATALVGGVAIVATPTITVDVAGGAGTTRPRSLSMTGVGA